MQRYLVTGGAGFIGSSLTRKLIERGDEVVVLDDFSTGSEQRLAGLGGSLDVVRGDVSRFADVERAIKGCDGVFHQAAIPSVVKTFEEPLRSDHVNAGGTLAVLEAARQAKTERVVLASSAAIYGNDPTMPKHEGMLPQPLSPYAASKLASEHHAHVYAQAHGMHTVALRYFNVYGPTQDPNGPYAAVIPCFVRALLGQGTATIYGDGEQSRDFCHVEDVVQANLLAMASDAAAGQCFNIAGGKAVTVRVLFDTLQQIIGGTQEPKMAPERVGDVRQSWADVTRAQERLGFTRRIELRAGLEQTVRDFAPPVPG